MLKVMVELRTWSADPEVRRVLWSIYISEQGFRWKGRSMKDLILAAVLTQISPPSETARGGQAEPSLVSRWYKARLIRIGIFLIENLIVWPKLHASPHCSPTTLTSTASIWQRLSGVSRACENVRECARLRADVPPRPLLHNLRQVSPRQSPLRAEGVPAECGNGPEGIARAVPRSRLARSKRICRASRHQPTESIAERQGVGWDGKGICIQGELCPSSLIPHWNIHYRIFGTDPRNPNLLHAPTNHVPIGL